MPRNLNMLDSVILDCIVSMVNCSFIGTIQPHGIFRIIPPSSLYIIFNHNISHSPWMLALNSASALVLATTNCFLLPQVTKLPSTTVQYPYVDYRSVTDPVQYAYV